MLLKSHLYLHLLGKWGGVKMVFNVEPPKDLERFKYGFQGGRCYRNKVENARNQNTIQIDITLKWHYLFRIPYALQAAIYKNS